MLLPTKELAALAESGQVTLANLDKVAAQAEDALAEFRVFLDAVKLIVTDASAQGLTITIKKGTTGE